MFRKRNGVRSILSCALLLSAFGTPALAQFLPGGGVDNADPTLPPEGVYLSPIDVHAMYTGADLAIVLTAVQHQPFQDQPPRYDPPMPPMGTPQNELHNFDSHLTATLTCEDIDPGACQAKLNGLPPGTPVIGTLQGRVETVANLKGPTDTTGTFVTEMLSMNLQGFGGMVMIRESPTLQSLGSTRITDNMDGTFHIDSFFDVFTELW
jgi:hypothetical protein